MTYRHFSVAFYAITVTLRVSHGLRRVTHVPGAVPLLAFLAREPGLPRQPVGVVAGRAAPRARDRVRTPRTRPPFGAADAGGRALHRARARDAGTLASPAARPARREGQAVRHDRDLRVGDGVSELPARAARRVPK